MEANEYFPYTHGDLIESQRKVLQELQQQELVKTLQQQEQQKLIDRR